MVNQARLPAGIAFLVAVFLVAVAGVAAAGASAAAVVQEGWWGDAPHLPGGVPDGALAVSARLGEVEKVAALGIALSPGPDETVDRLVLTLRSASDPRATVDPGGTARVVACPIVSRWSAARGGDITGAPKAYCALARSDGVATAAGHWRFDLTALAGMWSGSLAQHGVLLLENVDAPESFQLAFDDLAAGGVTLAAQTSVAGSSSRDGDSAPLARPGPAGEGPPAVGGGAGPSVQFPSADGSPSLPDRARGPSPAAPDDPGRSLRASATTSEEAVGVGLLENLPASTVLLFPALVVFAFVACYALGPAGDPDAVRPRTGAVSRAMAASEEPR